MCSVIVEARRSVTPAGCCPPAPTLCAIIEDLACSGFNLYLAAYCSWVERWDDGGESCAVLLLPFVLLVYAFTEVTKTLFYCQKVLLNLANK